MNLEFSSYSPHFIRRITPKKINPPPPSATIPPSPINGSTTCEDPPGFREGPTGKIYLAYLRDPNGNKICALHRPAK